MSRAKFVVSYNSSLCKEDEAQLIYIEECLLDYLNIPGIELESILSKKTLLSSLIKKQLGKSS